MTAATSRAPTAPNPAVEAPTGPMGDLKLGDEPQMNGHADPLVEKRRRYSADLYNYTNDQWQGVRKAIEASSRTRPADDTDSRTDSSISSSAESLTDKTEGVAAAAAAAPAV